MRGTFVEYVGSCKEQLGDCGWKLAGIEPVEVVRAATVHAQLGQHAVQVVRHEVVERAVAAIDFRQ